MLLLEGEKLVVKEENISKLNFQRTNKILNYDIYIYIYILRKQTINWNMDHI